MQPSDTSGNDRQKEAIRTRWSQNAATLGAMAAQPGGLLPAASDLIVDAITKRPSMRVLDIACGTGDPSIAVAAAIAPAGGHVTATDLVPEMLRQAESYASRRGVTNISFQQADAEELPFADTSFDAVTCRFGLMLVPDTAKALAEIRRVLVPGGVFVGMVWGPPERDALSSPLMAARRALGLPVTPVSDDKPHRFRYSTPGDMASLLRAAGFTDVTERDHEIPARFPISDDRVWETLLQMDEAIREAVAALPADDQAAVERHTLAAKQKSERRPGGPKAAVILVTGER